MKYGSYSLEIIGADALPVAETDKNHPQGEGLVGLADGEPYFLVLRNNSARRAGAEVYIDEDLKVRIIVPASGEVEVKRPADVDTRFIFAREGTTEFNDNLLDVIPRGDRGVVRVKFIPEVAKPVPTFEIDTSRFDDLLGSSRSLGFGDKYGLGGGLKSMSFGGDDLFPLRSLSFSPRSTLSRSPAAGRSSESESNPAGTNSSKSTPAADVPAATRSSTLSAGATRFGDETGQVYGPKVSFNGDDNPDTHVELSVRLAHNPERVLQLGPKGNKTPAPLEASPPAADDMSGSKRPVKGLPDPALSRPSGSGE